MPEKNDIAYGDLVQYEVVTTSEGQSVIMTTTLTIIGRVVAKLDPNASYAYMSANVGVYLVKTLFDPKSLYSSSLPEELEWDHRDALNVKSSALEWGSFPNDGILALIAERDIVNAIDENAEKVFKQYGRCPRCGHEGFWKVMSCHCPWHGKFLG